MAGVKIEEGIMPCDMCGEYYPDEESDSNYCQELDITVCDECLKRIEVHHKVDGKYMVDRCSECGEVKGVKWIKYKNRGRPVGSKNKPKPSESVQAVLTI